MANLIQALGNETKHWALVKLMQLTALTNKQTYRQSPITADHFSDWSSRERKRERSVRRRVRPWVCTSICLSVCLSVSVSVCPNKLLLQEVLSQFWSEIQTALKQAEGKEKNSKKEKKRGEWISLKAGMRVSCWNLWTSRERQTAGVVDTWLNTPGELVPVFLYPSEVFELWHWKRQ